MRPWFDPSLGERSWRKARQASFLKIELTPGICLLVWQERVQDTVTHPPPVRILPFAAVLSPDQGGHVRAGLPCFRLRLTGGPPVSALNEEKVGNATRVSLLLLTPSPATGMALPSLDGLAPGETRV